LIPAPYWVTYPEAVQLAGGVPVALPTDESTGFRVSVEQLEEARTERTKLLVFVSPSNPTGTVYTPEEVEAIGRWASEQGLWVVTDEIYEHLVYGGRTFTSMPVRVPELAEHCVVVNGCSKTYAMTGWRVGWLIGPLDLAAAVTNLQSHLTSNVANVAQAAAVAALNGGLDDAAAMCEAYDRRRLLVHRRLGEIDGVTCVEPEGAFYAFPSVAGLLGRELGGRTARTSLELAEVLLEAAGVAVVPGEAFGAPGYARISYALPDDELAEGLQHIAEVGAGRR
jgi:aspartate aminotransferase